MNWGTQLMFQDTGAWCFHTHHPELQICQPQRVSLTFFSSFQPPCYLSRPAQQSPHTLHLAATWEALPSPDGLEEWVGGCSLFSTAAMSNTNSSICQSKGCGCAICNLTFMNNCATVCAARCWEARKINWFCHEHPVGLFVSNAEQGSSRIPRKGCTEEGWTPAQNIGAGKGGKYGVRVCSSSCVMDKQGKELTEAAAGREVLSSVVGSKGLWVV